MPEPGAAAGRRYPGAYDAHATYGRLREAGLLGDCSYLHVSPRAAEIGWAPVARLRLDAWHEDWRARITGFAASLAPRYKAFGYAGFDVVDGAAGTRPDGSPGGPPLVDLIAPGETIAFDADGAVHCSEGGVDVAPHLATRATGDAGDRPRVALTPVAATSEAEFLETVGSAIARIRAREVHKVVASRYQAFDVQYDPLTLFEVHCLRRPFVDAFLICFGETVAVVPSPELLLDVEARRLVTNPLAGTRPRGATTEEDERLRQELRLDHKEIAEHVLSVTTMIEQLRPICEPGSVVVTELMGMCIQQRVQHLSSVLEARLGDGRHALDALWALFPSVTIAGFPKEAAIRAVRAIERTPRGLYSGVIGWVRGPSDCRFALTIRGIYRYGARTYLQAGAGIMIESVPELELSETTYKLAGAAEALAEAVARHRAG